MSIQKNKSIALLNTKAPFYSSYAKDALDIALIFGSYEQSPSLFFTGEAVWQLIQGHQPTAIKSKDFIKTFSAFEFYDIEKVYVCEQSLSARKLPLDFHLENIEVLSQQVFNQTLHAHDVIFTF